MLGVEMPGSLEARGEGGTAHRGGPVKHCCKRSVVRMGKGGGPKLFNGCCLQGWKQTAGDKDGINLPLPPVVGSDPAPTFLAAPDTSLVGP